MTARQAKTRMATTLRRHIKANMADIAVYLECQKTKNFEPCRQTRLYKIHPVEYCVLVGVAVDG